LKQIRLIRITEKRPVSMGIQLGSAVSTIPQKREFVSV
jgi:hypothetical protein